MNATARLRRSILMVPHTISVPATTRAGDSGHRMNNISMIMGRSRVVDRVQIEQKSEHWLQH
eukprot:515201-Heterocapsa_arctica.AAC.1